MFPHLFAVTILLGSSGLATAAPLVGAAAAPGVSSDTNPRLKAAVVDAQKSLGQLEPWQKKIFDNEVATQYQRFIKDYRAGGPGGEKLDVVVDLESLRNYLRFYGPTVLPRIWGKSATPVKDFKVLVYLRTDSACEKCQQAEKNLRTMVKSRMELRGLVPVWLTSDELGASARLGGKLLDEKVSELAKLKNYSGAVVLAWQPVPPDDIESAHADENHYFIHSFIHFRDLAKVEGKMELLDTDSFEIYGSRLLTDAMTEIGLRSAAAQSEPGAAKSEILLEVKGVRDFAQFSRIKSTLLSQIRGVSSFEEKMIARNCVTLAVNTALTKEEVEKQISAIAPEVFGAGVKLGIK